MARRVGGLAPVGSGVARHARAAAQDGVAVLVVPAALVRVSEHRVRTLQLLEARLGLLAAVEVPVGMPQQRLLTVGLLELIVGRGALHTQHDVVAPKRHPSSTRARASKLGGCNHGIR